MTTVEKHRYLSTQRREDAKSVKGVLCPFFATLAPLREKTDSQRSWPFVRGLPDASLQDTRRPINNNRPLRTWRLCAFALKELNVLQGS